MPTWSKSPKHGQPPAVLLLSDVSMLNVVYGPNGLVVWLTAMNCVLSGEVTPSPTMNWVRNQWPVCGSQ